MATHKTYTTKQRTQTSPQKEQPNLIRGLDTAVLATLLNARVPMIDALIERKEKSQVVTQELMLLEFNY
jgi:hypothetical protein